MSFLILVTVVDRDHCDSEYGPGMDSHGYILDLDEHSTEIYCKLLLQFLQQEKLIRKNDMSSSQKVTKGIK
jgi:hypothetical protein